MSEVFSFVKSWFREAYGVADMMNEFAGYGKWLIKRALEILYNNVNRPTTAIM
jgi:hypothetical protein